MRERERERERAKALPEIAYTSIFSNDLSKSQSSRTLVAFLPPLRVVLVLTLLINELLLLLVDNSFRLSWAGSFFLLYIQSGQDKVFVGRKLSFEKSCLQYYVIG